MDPPFLNPFHIDPHTVSLRHRVPPSVAKTFELIPPVDWDLVLFPWMWVNRVVHVTTCRCSTLVTMSQIISENDLGKSETVSCYPFATGIWLFTLLWHVYVTFWNRIERSLPTSTPSQWSPVPASTSTSTPSLDRTVAPHHVSGSRIFFIFMKSQQEESDWCVLLI